MTLQRHFGASETASLKLEMPCDLMELGAVAGQVREFLGEAGWSQEVIGDVNLALVEACTNAVKHVSPSARSQTIEVAAKLGPGELELRITDHTGGFRWPGQVSLPHPESESGRGLFLIRMLMDTVDYLHREEGNILILRKLRKPR